MSIAEVSSKKGVRPSHQVPLGLFLKQRGNAEAHQDLFISTGMKVREGNAVEETHEPIPRRCFQFS